MYTQVYFLIIFWIGILLITLKPKRDLRERARALLGQTQTGIKDSKLYKFRKELLLKRRHEKIISELSDSLSYIKNLAVMGRSDNISTQLLLTELSDFSDILRPVYLDMAHYINLNEKELAAQCLGIACGTDIGRDVGQFLSQWEQIDSEDLLPTLEVYRSSILSEKETVQRKKDELMSDLIYFPVVADCIMVLLNFVFVAYYLEQQDMLQMLL